MNLVDASIIFGSVKLGIYLGSYLSCSLSPDTRESINRPYVAILLVLLPSA